MQGGCRRASYEKWYIHIPPGHLAAKFLHLEQGWRDQSARPYDYRIVLHRFIQNPLFLHHHSQVNNIEPVAAQYYTRNILSDVMHVTLHRRIHYDRPSGILFPGTLHIWFEHCHSLLHYLRRLDHLREEHLA